MTILHMAPETPMKQLQKIGASVAVAGLILGWSARRTLAEDMPDFSGKYSVESKGAAGPDGNATLEVVQSQNAIVITRVEAGRTTSSRCPFDGSKGDYTSPGGVPGKCKAQFKGKNLLIESIAVAHPSPTVTPVRLRIKER
jgi:hypothetical protein